jgi:hypothetical protein
LALHAVGRIRPVFVQPPQIAHVQVPRFERFRNLDMSFRGSVVAAIHSAGMICRPSHRPWLRYK